MSTIKGMLDKALQAKHSVEPITLKIVQDNNTLIIDLNRDKQLSLGLNPDGDVIGTYSKATEEIFGGAEKGKYEGEPYNFKDTGDLFKAFKLEFNNGQLSLFSTDSKVPLLQRDYGQLFGLMNENQKILNYDIIKPDLVKAIKEILHR